MQSILDQNTDTTALDSLKEQEKPLLAANPDAPVTKPSSLLKRYIDTGQTIFKDAAGIALSTLHSAAQGVRTVTGDVLSNHYNYTGTQSIMKPSEEAFNWDALARQEKDAIIEKTKKSFANAETGGVKNPEIFSQPAGAGYGMAHGIYQITDKLLKERSQKLLGFEVSGAQLIAHPNLQHRFIEAQIESWAKQGLTPDEMAAHWRGMHAADLPVYKKNFDSIFNGVK